MGAGIGIADDLGSCRVTSVVRNIEAGLKGGSTTSTGSTPCPSATDTVGDGTSHAMAMLARASAQGESEFR